MVEAPGLHSTWQGEGLVREVFTLSSGEWDLYASLYAADAPAITRAIVVCGGWGVEGRFSERLSRAFARGIAGMGGAALVFDWPGQGDSGGDPRNVSLEEFIAAVGDAAAQLSDRFPGAPLGLAGVRFGAAPAVLACESLSASVLILIQPALDPESHFEEMETTAARATLGRVPTEGWAFGFPLPDRSSFRKAGDRVLEVMTRFSGSGAVVGYGSIPAPSPIFESIDVRGDWRHATRSGDTRLSAEALRWLKEGVSEP